MLDPQCWARILGHPVGEYEKSTSRARARPWYGAQMRIFTPEDWEFLISLCDKEVGEAVRQVPQSQCSFSLFFFCATGVPRLVFYEFR